MMKQSSARSRQPSLILCLGRRHPIALMPDPIFIAGLFGKLVEKLIDFAIRHGQEARKPRTRLARDIYVLHASLVNCHHAYERYQNEHEVRSLRAWATALDSFVKTLANLQTTLQIFAPDVVEHLKGYGTHEYQLYAALSDPAASANAAAMELALLVGDRKRADTSSGSETITIDDRDFTNAVSRLGEFIRTTFTIDEIYANHDA
jgi:hypothetical protein